MDSAWSTHGRVMQEPMFSYMTSMHYMVYIVKGTVAGERLFALPLPSPLPRPLNAQYRQVTKAKMANKFLQSWRSFGSSFCRGMQHFHGVKVQRWKALTRYTACRYMSSIVDRKSLKINKSFNHVVTMPALFHTSSWTLFSSGHECIHEVFFQLLWFGLTLLSGNGDRLE